MNKIVPLFVFFLLLSFSSSMPAEQPENFKIIVNTSNDATSMTKAQVSYLFLKKVTKWKNGHKVLPVDQTETQQ